ncbi:4-hydroxybutyrate CoA-transferase [Aquihabitans sp. G128]|uniref:acetyl-CoA hydrolase/transferase family protein n=1 Tax=Aquihabitans sp. G128 TaxID=2849779 RepID=UPI001C234A09|nr:acetyl-CoA hydrolase/transferase C-terminal domain-containing protein [Aquihabitans sp. G128]QXC62127.1 4-hydroxybutyrate CoA-transferase [Aquihabitans sp. G128]
MTERLSPEEAAALVRPVDVVGIPLGPGHPGGFLHALGGRTDWEDLLITGALLTDFYEVFGRPNVRFLSGFFGPLERLMRDQGGAIEFVPADFRRFAPALEAINPRVMATAATPPDAGGWCSLSLHAGATIGQIEKTADDPDRILVVEASSRYPRTLGLGEHGHRIHVDRIDVLVETDHEPFVIGEPEPSPEERAIAEQVAAFVTEGCTIQTGIGGIPSTVATLLAEGPVGGFGIHSEMFTTGCMKLHQAGKVTNVKGVYDGYSITTFAAGTRELYDWLDGNEEVRFLPVHLVNSPEVISQNSKMVSINGALAVDLAGQAVADTLAGAQYSGIGGHEDFVAASGLELEDRSLICLRSSTTVNGQRVSRIASQFPAGTIITTPRHQLDVVVTEHGVAELRGRTVRERARALAAIAHPDFRDQLLADAEMWPPG